MICYVMNASTLAHKHALSALVYDTDLPHAPDSPGAKESIDILRDPSILDLFEVRFCVCCRQ